MEDEKINTVGRRRAKKERSAREGKGRRENCGRGREMKKGGVRGCGTYGSSAFSRICSFSVPSIRALSRLFKDPSPSVS